MSIIITAGKLTDPEIITIEITAAVPDLQVMLLSKSLINLPVCLWSNRSICCQHHSHLDSSSAGEMTGAEVITDRFIETHSSFNMLQNTSCCHHPGHWGCFNCKYCFITQCTVTVRATGRLSYPKFTVIKFTYTVPSRTDEGLTAPNNVTFLVIETVSTTGGVTPH